MNTFIQINSNNSKPIYDYALPTLENYQFKNPILKAYLHETCGLYYFFQGKLDSVKIQMQASEAIMKKTAPKNKRMGAAYEYLGFYYSFSSIHDTSLIYMNKAADLHLSNRDTLAYVKVIKYISSFYSVMGKRENALKYLLKAKNFIKVHPPAAYYIHRVNIGIADIQTELKDYKNAEKAYREGFATLQADKVLSEEKKAVSLWDFSLGIALTLLRTERAEAALEYILKAEEYCQKYNLSKLQLASTKLVESEARVALKQYERANNLLEDVINNSNGKIDAHNIKIAKILSDIIFTGKRLPSKEMQAKIEPILNRIIEKNKTGYNQDLLQAYKLRTVFNISKGNKNVAIDDLRNLLIQTDTLWNKNKVEAAEELLIAYETKEKDQLLEIQKLQLAKRNWQRSTLTTLVIGLLLLVGIIYVSYTQKRQYASQLEETVEEQTEELSLANQELKRSNYELKTFNYIASHDIKEPIRSIGNYVGFIQRKLPKSLQGELANDFSTIRKSTAQLYTLVEDFTKYISFSHDNVVFHTEKVDLNTTVESLKVVLFKALKTTNGKIINHGLPTIYSSSSMLYVALKSLVENGLKYNESSTPTVELNYRETDTQYEIIVSDNGIGIDEAYHEQIFEMFKRLNNRNEYEGSGIGLSIAKLAVDKLNGSIHVKSKKNEGSQFILTLPKQKNKV